MEKSQTHIGLMIIREGKKMNLEQSLKTSKYSFGFLVREKASHTVYNSQKQILIRKSIGGLNETQFYFYSYLLKTK